MMSIYLLRHVLDNIFVQTILDMDAYLYNRQYICLNHFIRGCISIYWTIYLFYVHYGKIGYFSWVFLCSSVPSRYGEFGFWIIVGFRPDGCRFRFIFIPTV
jgi:hypothetical protein